MSEKTAATETKPPRHRKSWRRFLRFDLGTMVCFILALNLIFYANWQMRKGYHAVIETQKENHVVLRPRYEVGWPWHFLRINGMKNRLPTHTDADSEPLVEVLSWADAAKSLAVNGLLLLVLTTLLLWLKTAIFSETPTVAHGQRRMKKIPPDFV